MFKLFKDAFKISNKNIILIIPLIIFVKIFDLYSMYSRYNVNTMLKLIITSVTILFLFSVFCSGWFYMVKSVISSREKIPVKDILIKIAPEGIGIYFLSFAGLYIIFFLIQIIATPLVYMLGVKLIGAIDETSIQSLQNIAGNSSAIASVADSLTPQQIIFLGKWSLLFMFVTTLIMYLLMLWIPQILYDTPDAFFALGESVKKIFKNPLQTFVIFIILWLIGFALLFTTTFAIINPIFYFIMNIIMFYFTLYFVVLIFLYYEKIR